jgi:ribonucleoside-diphosphate reductase alpha chain
MSEVAHSYPSPLPLVVIKRSGHIVPFNKDRIFLAIRKAFEAEKLEQEGKSELTPIELENISAVVTAVVEDLGKFASGKEGCSVEYIQDLVEVKLLQSNNLAVARRYIRYRDQHKALRDESLDQVKVIRRDGKGSARFNPIKIANAVERAFRASFDTQGSSPESIVLSVNSVTDKVINKCKDYVATANLPLNIEWIQDIIEQQMMIDGYYQVAKDFILYRAKRAEFRHSVTSPSGATVTEDIVLVSHDAVASELETNVSEISQNTFIAQDALGNTVEIQESELMKRVLYACRGLSGVKARNVLQDAIGNFYEGVRLHEIDTCLILAARAKIEEEPNYSFVSARLLLQVCYQEAGNLNPQKITLKQDHESYFLDYIKLGVENQLLSPDLLGFDLEKLANAIDLTRDHTFTYLGLQTLYDRYLIHKNGVRIETPQAFWMRVAMGLSLNEGKNKNERAIEFYSLLSSFDFISSTPTLFNSGTLHSQMSSCYLTTISDDLGHIFKCISDDAQLSKWAGGLGNDWTNIRATGARIKGTNGKSQGIIPFLKVANDTAVAVNQGGKRKGAMCAYLETWHLDVEDFLELRKNTGDERRRTHDMNTANWIPDLFMKRVLAGQDWTLFSPSDVSDLHDLYGKAFEARYCEYEKLAETGEIKLYKKIPALDLWRKMLSMLFETGHPWITFKDPSNIRSPQDHVGVVHSSNLCTEILLNTSETETAVCNLGSINMVAHIQEGRLDRERLSRTIKTAVRMLDNVIDINFYPTPESKNANLKHRPIGLGLMGFQDALYKLRISYASQEAVNFADESMELISYYAILSSSELAKERGTYETYKGSKWSRGILPIDSISLLEEERESVYLDVDKTTKLDWSIVRKAIAENGMRNSNTMAIAPTATISNIAGITQSIEPSFKHLYTKSNLSGEFMISNTYLVDDLKNLGIWDEAMIDDLKYFDGSINEIERVPEDLKQLYLTSFDIEPEWLIECASRRQKWIDMGQSLNLYICQPNGKRLNDMYFLAWKKGLKTTYYLRSTGATQIEKSTTDINRRGLQPRWMKEKSASSNIQVDRATVLEAPKAPADIDGACESCQ